MLAHRCRLPTETMLYTSTRYLKLSGTADVTTKKIPGRFIRQLPLIGVIFRSDPNKAACEYGTVPGTGRPTTLWQPATGGRYALDPDLRRRPPNLRLLFVWYLRFRAPLELPTKGVSPRL